jgi:hypothetical protein
MEYLMIGSSLSLYPSYFFARWIYSPLVFPSWNMVFATEEEEVDRSPLNNSQSQSDTDVGNGDSTAKAGQLDFEQYTRGGLGRHLGVFSTTFLMYVSG